MAASDLYGAIELGGTKTICLIGSGPDDILAEAQFQTRAPNDTLADCLAFFHKHDVLGPLTRIGIATFGPVALDLTSACYGHILKTPKPGWSGFDIAGSIARALSLPVVIETDVIGAALAEGRWGAARGIGDYAYITVGTGIGGGLIVEGRPVHGALHPELGHISVPHDWIRDPYPGHCPFHGDCLEGLACGPAIADRWGMDGAALPTDHPAWALEADYLSVLAANLLLMTAPRRILWGGGVMQPGHLLPMLRTRTRERLNGYIAAPPLDGALEDVLVAPGLGDRAGPLGALALALGATR